MGALLVFCSFYILKLTPVQCNMFNNSVAAAVYNLPEVSIIQHCYTWWPDLHILHIQKSHMTHPAHQNKTQTSCNKPTLYYNDTDIKVKGLN